MSKNVFPKAILLLTVLALLSEFVIAGKSGKKKQLSSPSNLPLNSDGNNIGISSKPEVIQDIKQNPKKRKNNEKDEPEKKKKEDYSKRGKKRRESPTAESVDNDNSLLKKKREPSKELEEAIQIDAPQNDPSKYKLDSDDDDRNTAGTTETALKGVEKAKKALDDEYDKLVKENKLKDFKMHNAAKGQLDKQNSKALDEYINASVIEVVVFNVGQGNGMIIKTKKAFWVIDFGSDKAPTLFASPSNVITLQDQIDAAKKYLRTDNLPIIDFTSHFDADHYNKKGDLLKDFTKRIKFFIYGNGYDSSRFGDVMDEIAKKVNIEANRFVVTREFIRKQSKDQKIFFVNSPEIDPKETNASSLMLHLVLENGKTVLLTGDATMKTVADIKIACEQTMKADNLESWTNAIEWKLFTNVDYYVAPHHGADTDNSHLLIHLVKPKQAVIFSAPIFSQHHHPTFSAIQGALRAMDDYVIPDSKNSHYVYAENTEELNYKALVRSLKDTKASLVLNYGTAIKPQNIVQEIDTVKLRALKVPTFYPRYPKYIWLKTALEIYVTGVSGHIKIDKDGCSKDPKSILPQKIVLKEPEENLKAFVIRITTFDGQEDLIVTDFDRENLLRTFDKIIELVNPVQESEKKLVRKAKLSTGVRNKDNKPIDWFDRLGMWMKSKKRLLII